MINRKLSYCTFNAYWPAPHLTTDVLFIKTFLLCGFLVVSAASYAVQSSEGAYYAFLQRQNDHVDNMSTQSYQTDLRQPDPDFGSFTDSGAVVAPKQIYLKTKIAHNRSPDGSTLVLFID